MSTSSWIVQCKMIKAPYSVLSKKVKAITAADAMEKVMEMDKDCAAVSVRVDFSEHRMDQRTFSL